MKKISFLILFIFCLGFTFGGTFCVLPQDAVAEVSTKASTFPTLTLANSNSAGKTSLSDYIANYESNCLSNPEYSSYNIVLGENITLTNPLTASIGTEANPFKGEFNGRGYTISGLNVDVSAGAGVKYAGLFGVTSDGAKISNLKISGNVTLNAGSGLSSYMGAVVGKAVATEIENVQVDVTSITYNTAFDNSVNFGVLAGTMEDGSVAENIICRATNLGTWNFNRNDNQSSAFGGVCGRLIGSKINFAIVGVNVKATVTSNFAGNLSVGGVAGSVRNGPSEIINVGLECTLPQLTALNSQSKVDVGEVVGVIATPAPNQEYYLNNLSYIHFKDNVNVNVFGDQGDYEFSLTNNLGIYSTPIAISSREYFSMDSLQWYTPYGIWDFDRVWTLSGQMNLQCFSNDFKISISQNLRKDVLTLKNEEEVKAGTYRYGDKVALDFAFVTKIDTNEMGERTINLRDYFDVEEIQLDSTRKGGIIFNNGAYSISYDGSEFFDIETIDNGFRIIVNSLTRATSGEYNITVREKEFSSNITSRLYGRNGQLIEGAKPGYIYDASGSINTTKDYSPKLTYGNTYYIQTSPEEVINSFEGWYMVMSDGQADKCLTSDASQTILEFEFGSGNFLGDVNLYARYSDNARRINFTMDSGVAKVVIANTTVTNDTEKVISVSKDLEELKLEIYINDGYDFDVDSFIQMLETYKTQSSQHLCDALSEVVRDGYRCFEFRLYMRTLQGQWAEELPVSIRTTPQAAAGNSMIWIIIGAVAGVVVLGLIIFLIIFFTKRRGFGGGGGNTMKKKSYKNMYF